MNNRKQRINSFLNSLTLREIDDYLKENNINKDIINKLELIKRNKERNNQNTHLSKLFTDVVSNFNSKDLYLLGEANVIATILYYGLQEDFNIEDFIGAYNIAMNNEPRLKEYVYEIMKDF